MFEDKFPSDSMTALSVIIFKLQVLGGKEDIKITTYKVVYLHAFKSLRQRFKK